MKASIVRFFCALGLFTGWCCFLLSTEPTSSPGEGTKKYTLSVAAIFKDEAPYFKEWIEYHRLVGVDHFYLYDNGSTDTFKQVLEPYVKEGVVTLIDWPDKNRENWQKIEYAWVYYTQVPALEHACRTVALGQTKWLAMIDIDEFIVPKNQTTIPDVLKKYDDAPGVIVYWHVYGTSGVNTLPPNVLLVEALNMTCEEGHQLNKVEKTIIKPEMFSSFLRPPHTCVYAGGGAGGCLPKAEMQINHYINRTIEYFYNSKVKKKEAMDNTKLSPDYIIWWSNVGNAVEDQERTIHRFVPEVRKRVGFDSQELNK